MNCSQHNTLIVFLPDYIWVVKLLQPFQQSHLSDGGDWEAILVCLYPHALQSHKLPALCISGLVDRPVSPASDLCHGFILETGAVSHRQDQLTRYETKGMTDQMQKV